MNLRNWLLSLFDSGGRGNHRRPHRKVYATPQAWVKNTSPIPDEPFFEAGGPAVKRHFALVDQIEAAWKSGDRPKILRLCQAQIALGPEVLAALTEEEIMNGRPSLSISHTGYFRLAMLHEKEKNYQEAISVCEQAIADGWADGEFSHRAARCRKKLAKLP